MQPTTCCFATSATDTQVANPGTILYRHLRGDSHLRAGLESIAVHRISPRSIALKSSLSR